MLDGREVARGTTEEAALAAARLLGGEVVQCVTASGRTDQCGVFGEHKLDGTTICYFCGNATALPPPTQKKLQEW